MGSDDPRVVSPNEADRNGAPERVAARFDWSEPDQPGMALVSVLASITRTDPVAMEPLHRTVDVDALDSLFRGRDGSGSDAVAFAVEGRTIRVERGGRIVVGDGTG